MDVFIKNTLINSKYNYNQKSFSISLFTCKKKQISFPKYTTFALISQSTKGRNQDSNTSKVEDSIKLTKIEKQLAEEQLISTFDQKILVFSTLLVDSLIILRGISKINDPISIVFGLTAAIIAFITADFLSGVYHWGIDNYGSKETPIFGNQIHGFQRHHKYPWTITYRQFCNRISPICKSALPFCLILIFINDLPSSLEIWLSMSCLFVIFSQQFHSWSHSKRNQIPKWVMKMHQAKIFISPLEHYKHHRPPYKDYYCIVNGFWNPILDKSGFFRFLEKFIYDNTNIKPRSWLNDNEEAVEYYADTYED